MYMPSVWWRSAQLYEATYIEHQPLSAHCLWLKLRDGIQVRKGITGWWFGTWILFSHILGIMILIDFHISQRGWNHQPDKINSLRWPPSFSGKSLSPITWICASRGAPCHWSDANPIFFTLMGPSLPASQKGDTATIIRCLISPYTY